MENPSSRSQEELRVWKQLPTFNTSKLELIGYTAGEQREKQAQCAKEELGTRWEEKKKGKQKNKKIKTLKSVWSMEDCDENMNKITCQEGTQQREGKATEELLEYC